MKRLVFLMIIFFVVTMPALIYTQTMSEYCSAPPYVTRTVPPNIMILIDNSEDMGHPAYGNEYKPNTGKDNYYGLFDPKGCYNPSVSAYFQRMGPADYAVSGQENTGCPTGQFNGNILNWATMSRLTVVKKVIMGGKFEPRPTNPNIIVAEGGEWAKTGDMAAGCSWQVTSSGGNISLTVGDSGPPGSCNYPKGGSWRVKIVRTIEKYAGVFQDFTDQLPKDNNFDRYSARFGLTDFGNGGSVVLDMYIPPNNYEDYLNRIQNIQPRDSSPLATAHKSIIDYFASPPSGADPYKSCASWETSFGYCKDGTQIPCRKSFILILTSGNDVNGVAVTSTASCNQPDSLVRNACYAFNADLRTDISSPPKQNAYTYVVHAWGSAANKTVLQNTAAAGGGGYYEAGEGDLEGSITRAVQDILAKAASGTSVSVLTTSTRGAGSVLQAYFLPTRNEGPRQVSWTGYLQNIWIDPADNLREDTDSDYRLMLAQDRVMKLYFDADSNETKAAFFTTDAKGSGGTLSTCSSPEVKPFSNIAPVWEAGKKLALRDPSKRTMFTSKKVIRGDAEAHNFPESPYAEFKPGMNTDLINSLNADATYTAEKIVRYIRGECLERSVQGDTACGSTSDPSYRDRTLTVDGSLRVWKLGDIMSSTPKAFSNGPLNTYHIDYSDSSYYSYISSNAYKRKSSVAFVGANDGMLHAFRVGYLKDMGLIGIIKALFKDFFSSDDDNHDQLGEEVWAYIPFNTFPYLKYLADPNYCHIYYSDLSVRLVDASTNGTASSIRTAGSWQTILVGGMRFGGACSGSDANPAGPPIADGGFSSYFAIDISDPEHPVPLWEFSDADMGYATTFPSIIRTGDRDQNGHWYVAFGSGPKVLPKGGRDIGRSTPGHIYILDLKTGTQVQKIQLEPATNSYHIVGDILAVDDNKDYSSEKIYFGTSYYSSGWRGKLMRLDIPNQDLSTWTPSSSDIKTLFSGNYPFTASPDAVKDTQGKVWIFSGSGKYYGDTDETDASQQIFMGIIDAGRPVTESSLDSTTTKTTGTVQGTAKVCAYNSTSKSFELQDVVTSIAASASPPAAATVGWKIPLYNGERVISRPLAVGGLVDFLTYKPDADPCTYGGDSFLYSVGYTSGLAPAKVAILAPGATSGTSGSNVEVYKGIRLGPGAPPTGEAIIVPPPGEGAETIKKKIQVATGVIVEAENQPTFSVVSKIIHRLKK